MTIHPSIHLMMMMMIVYMRGWNNLMIFVLVAVAYPPPQPPAAYSAPPPAGYPTKDSSDNPATTASVPVKTQYREDGFWKGWSVPYSLFSSLINSVLPHWSLPSIIHDPSLLIFGYYYIYFFSLLFLCLYIGAVWLMKNSKIWIIKYLNC